MLCTFLNQHCACGIWCGNITTIIINVSYFFYSRNQIISKIWTSIQFTSIIVSICCTLYIHNHSCVVGITDYTLTVVWNLYSTIDIQSGLWLVIVDTYLIVGSGCSGLEIHVGSVFGSDGKLVVSVNLETLVRAAGKSCGINVDVVCRGCKSCGNLSTYWNSGSCVDIHSVVYPDSFRVEQDIRPCSVITVSWIKSYSISFSIW